MADQEARLRPSTYRKYDDILDLFRSCLEGYWPGHSQEEYNQITAKGGTFCGTFGPEEITGGLGEFLGYFMPHKVIAGKETMKAAGTVTKKLVKWLAEKGYVEDEGALEMAEERAGEAARDLPAAQDVADLLDAYVDEHAPDRILDRIVAFSEANGSGVLIEKRSKGYSLFREDNGRPVARLRPTGKGDRVEVMWWSHRDQWDQIGDFGPMVMPLDEALEYVAKDPMGIFWG